MELISSGVHILPVTVIWHLTLLLCRAEQNYTRHVAMFIFFMDESVLLNDTGCFQGKRQRSVFVCVRGGGDLSALYLKNGTTKPKCV